VNPRGRSGYRATTGGSFSSGEVDLALAPDRLVVWIEVTFPAFLLILWEPPACAAGLGHDFQNLELGEE
jgi:hypothetical protein